MTKKIELPEKRYVSVSYRGVKGIRKDTKNQTFLVAKTIRGKRHSATFTTAREAADWKKNFHPALSFTPSVETVKKTALKTLNELKIRTVPSKKKNGEDFGFSVGDAWTLYVERHLSKLQYSSCEHRLERGRAFLKRIMAVSMVDINADFVSEHLALEREKSLNSKNSKRYNFDEDLKTFKSFLNWYRENIDSMFVNPVLKRHKREGMVRELPRRKKKMRTHELMAFFNTLGPEGNFWRDFAEIQFYFSGRVQEVAGLQWKSVDFVDGEIEIENVAIWDNKKNFCYLKNSTKNGEARKIPMTEAIFRILKRRRAERNPALVEDAVLGRKVPLDFVFQLEGRPLKYRMIQHRYNQALKKAGLHEYSSTHILRHTMANLVRERMGLDHAQAVGGWKTRTLVERVYTEAPSHLTRTALENIQDLLDTVDGKAPETGAGLNFFQARKTCKRRANQKNPFKI